MSQWQHYLEHCTILPKRDNEDSEDDTLANRSRGIIVEAPNCRPFISSSTTSSNKKHNIGGIKVRQQFRYNDDDNALEGIEIENHLYKVTAVHFSHVKQKRVGTFGLPEKYIVLHDLAFVKTLIPFKIIYLVKVF
jgi:hypothetical protein